MISPKPSTFPFLSVPPLDLPQAEQVWTHSGSDQTARLSVPGRFRSQGTASVSSPSTADFICIVETSAKPVVSLLQSCSGEKCS